MTLLINQQLLHHVQVQSIAKRNISSLTQAKFTPHCVVFLGQYQASIMNLNHQSLSQLSIFCRSFTYASLYTPSSFDLHIILLHSVQIFLFVLILLIFYPVHSFLFSTASFFVHMLHRLHGLFKMIVFLLHCHQ